MLPMSLPNLKMVDISQTLMSYWPLINVTDFDLTVSVLATAGKTDMGGGLIWRARDDQNYYITRANPLEQNIRFYRVVNGVRHEQQTSIKLFPSKPGILFN